MEHELIYLNLKCRQCLYLRTCTPTSALVKHLYMSYSMDDLPAIATRAFFKRRHALEAMPESRARRNDV